MENLIGKRLNQRYEVRSLLGEGGMGAVLHGFDAVLEREVAIKVMHPHFARHPNMRERFLQEARTAGKLNHSSIVKVYDFGQQEALLFIVMEFIDGDNLRTILDNLRLRGKRITIQESVLVTSQLSSALEYAHRHGVLHRDIKPANIMIVPESVGGLSFRPVLTDLGLAKLLEGQSITREGVSLGTPAYMSPEQAVGRKIDARSDVYSLGILLYELCVGHPPFPAKSISDAIRYHTKETPPAPRSIRADIPAPVEAVILTAIAREPEDRYQSAESFSTALRGLADEASHVPVPVSASIMTEYAQSLAERGKSILREFQPVSGRTVDILQVLDENRVSSAFEITGRSMTIGREKNNDFMIEDNKLSRQHARLEFDGKDYYITDLQSTNGTFLANTRLLPGVPELWAAEKAVRMGNTWFHLKRAAVNRNEPDTDRYTEQMDPMSLPVSAPELTGKRVTATIANTSLAVNPGESIQVTVKLLNHGQLVDHYRLNILGVPANWITVSDKGIQLMPQERSELVFTIHPPRQPESQAGEYPLKVQVLSHVTAGEQTEIDTRLVVNPYYQFDFVIRPQRQRGTTEAVFTPVLRNICNTDLTFELSAEDPEDRCDFQFEPALIVTHPGHEATGKMRVSLQSGRQPEAVRSFAFTVTARAKENLELTKQSFGEWEKTPLLLEVQIRPSSVRSIGPGQFQVMLHNRGDQDIPVQLEGSDDEGVCSFHFDPRSVVVSVGGEQRVNLAVSSEQRLRPDQDKTIAIDIKASLVNSPNLVQNAKAQWVRVHPAIDGSLQEIAPGGKAQGRFQVTVKNLSEDDITLNLAGVDPHQKCSFEFFPSSLTLPAYTEKDVPLTIRPHAPLYGEVRYKHNFQVIMNPAGYPEVQKRLDSIWEQYPEDRKGSLFLCWLLICIAWAFAVPLGGLAYMQLLSLGGSSETELLVAGIIAGLLTGVTGGLGTGLGMKAGYPQVKFRHILGSAVVWSALWCLYYGPLVFVFR